MDESNIKPVAEIIFSKLNLNLEGGPDPALKRPGVKFWFKEYGRQRGPIFTFGWEPPKRHVVTLRFGAYSTECIKHIRENSSDDSFATALGCIGHIAENHEVAINSEPFDDASLRGEDLNLKIDPSLVIRTERKTSDVHSAVEISRTTQEMLLFFVAAMIELLGSEEEMADEDMSGEVEGEVTRVQSIRRERNKSNRALCLSIHGEICGVCGFESKANFTEEIGSIMEVHHIEPLSKLDSPKTFDPRNDLIPLCPNCHRAIHKKDPPYLPQDLKNLVEK